jgi:hypothetical protein
VSPLPATDMQVLLAPDGLRVGRLGWRWRGIPQRVLRQQWQEPAASWSAALGALEALLHAHDKPARLHVTLSNRLVRYAAVPWQAGLNARAAQAWQRDCLVRLYGDRALAWHLAATPATRRTPGLASAVDAALISELRALCGRTGTRLAVVQPQLAAVVNRWRRALRADCFWLVIAEPGYLCLALALQRGWREVRTARTGDDTLAALPALLRRETLLAETDASPTHVYLWAPDLETGVLEELGGLPATELCDGTRHAPGALCLYGAAQ